MAEEIRRDLLRRASEALEPELDVGRSATHRSLSKEDLTIICAWCETLMQQGSTLVISHGMCAECKQSLMSDAETSPTNAVEGNPAAGDTES